MIRLLIIYFCLMAVPKISSSQESDFGNWWIYFGNKKIGNRWNIHHEVQYRNYNFLGDTEQLLLRTGLGYNLSENNNNLLLGYGFIHAQNYLETTDTKSEINEHRIYQQFITKQSFGRFTLQHRYRLEERFVEEMFKIRFRYFLAAKMALNKQEIGEKVLYFSVYNEIFLGVEGQIFDRNRLYTGLGYAVTSNLKFELGYMTQLFQGGQRDQMNVIGSFSF